MSDELGTGSGTANGISRRRFLTLAGGSATAGFAWAHMGGIAFAAGAPVESTFFATVTRRSDGLNLTFQGFNLVLDKSDPQHPVLRRRSAEGAAYLVVHFPPQSLLEEAFPVPGTDPTARPVGARLARQSRLAFEIPAGTAIAFNLQTLLDFSRLEPELTPIASSTGKPATDIRKPLDYETSIEMPWSLVLNPDPNQRFRNSVAAPPDTGVVELWHTNLTPVEDIVRLTSAAPLFRAVWAEDAGIETRYKDPSAEPEQHSPFMSSLTPQDRARIVRATSGRSTSSQPLTGVAPARYNRLMLTPLGGWLDTDNVWSKLGFEWTHRMTFGRDHFVRLVKYGYLLPFNIKAAVVEVTERRVTPGSRGAPTAYLRRQRFIVIREARRDFSTALARQRMPYQSRALPFSSVRTTTLRSGPITEQQLGNVLTSHAFIPVEQSGEFRLQMIGTDRDGAEVHFSAPTVFVYKEAAERYEDAFRVRAAYLGRPADSAVRRSDLGGQKIHFAPPSSPGKGDTAIPATSLVWGLDLPLSSEQTWFQSNEWAQLFPRLYSADVVVDSVAAITGTEAPTTLDYYGQYLEAGLNSAGLPSNKAEVFMKLAAAVPATPPIPLPPGLVGNLVDPPVNVVGMSRLAGVLSGSPLAAPSNILTTLAAGEFNPKLILKNLKAKLLGTINLIDIIKAATDYLDPGQSGPTTLISTKKDFGVETVLTWQPVLQDDPVAKVFKTIPNPAAKPEDTDLDKTLTRMKLVATSFVPGKGATRPAGGHSEIELKKFILNIPGGAVSSHGLELRFERLSFVAGTERATDVQPDITSIEFRGALKMLQPVVDLLGFAPKSPSGAGSAKTGAEEPKKAPKPFSHKVTAAGIEVTLTVSIPKISLGAFVLKNLNIGGGATLPLTPFTESMSGLTEDLDGKALAALKGFTFHLKVGTRQSPVELTVAFFKGTAYVHVEGGGEGLTHLEIGFEFGATYSLDLGVASGGVSAVGGFTFSYTTTTDADGKTTQKIEFAAHLKLSGHLDILGLITVSVVFFVSLNYVNDGGRERLYGRAYLSISIDIAFFSKTITLECEREFASGGGGGGSGSPGAGALGAAEQGALTSGSASDLTFESLFQQQSQWNAYAGAFV